MPTKQATSAKAKAAKQLQPAPPADIPTTPPQQTKLNDPSSILHRELTGKYEQAVAVDALLRDLVSRHADGPLEGPADLRISGAEVGLLNATCTVHGRRVDNRADILPLLRKARNTLNLLDSKPTIERLLDAAEAEHRAEFALREEQEKLAKIGKGERIAKLQAEEAIEKAQREFANARNERLRIRDCRNQLIEQAPPALKAEFDRARQLADVQHKPAISELKGEIESLEKLVGYSFGSGRRWGTDGVSPVWPVVDMLAPHASRDANGRRTQLDRNAWQAALDAIENVQLPAKRAKLKEMEAAYSKDLEASAALLDRWIAAGRLTLDIFTEV